MTAPVPEDGEYRGDDLVTSEYNHYLWYVTGPRGYDYMTSAIMTSTCDIFMAEPKVHDLVTSDCDLRLWYVYGRTCTRRW